MSTATPHTAAPEIDRLENGDRMTRPEFERRYAAMRDVKKAELIEGRVYMPSPVHQSTHGGPHADVLGWLSFYRMFTPGLIAGDNSTLQVDWHNEPQPDALLMLEAERGGQARINERGFVEGCPGTGDRDCSQ
jgi:hypothetical protein